MDFLDFVIIKILNKTGLCPELVAKLEAETPYVADILFQIGKWFTVTTASLSGLLTIVEVLPLDVQNLVRMNLAIGTAVGLVLTTIFKAQTK